MLGRNTSHRRRFYTVLTKQATSQDGLELAQWQDSDGQGHTLPGSLTIHIYTNTHFNYNFVLAI